MEIIKEGGMHMLNSILVARQRMESGYKIILKLPEKEYFEIYEELDKKAAEDILEQYLSYHGDDGSYSNVNIDINRNTHIVTIRARLDYLDNSQIEGTLKLPRLVDKI